MSRVSLVSLEWRTGSGGGAAGTRKGRVVTDWRIRRITFTSGMKLILVADIVVLWMT